ncbi:ROK family protein [bacterium]|nr:ROK family protein [bacterium]PIV81261.1 MAG: glucokinase [bacterium CG17_big_fil_post_rev_8_21_14_2_50_64_8]PJA77150.1 MAG: glucokinase [bacterium CG_4_9_14_3_um_filter_65_15]
MKRPVLGVDVGGTRAKFVVLGDRDQVLQTGDAASDSTSAAATLHAVAAALDPVLWGLEDAAGTRDMGLGGVGLACAGIVDPHRGWLGRSPNLPGWENSDLFAAVGGVFGNVDRTVLNDVNSALYGEFRRGAGQGCRDLIMIALGTGVGGGVILQDSLLIGAHCGAGEIGHMVLDPDGPVCPCGNRGCLEAYAGSVALLKSARRAAGEGTGPLADLVRDQGEDLTPRDLADLANGGDGASRELFAAAGRKLGQAVGNLVNVLDPQRVIIGGGVAGAGELILGPCREVAPTIILAEEARDVDIVPASLGTGAAAIGAALMAGRQESTP